MARAIRSQESLRKEHWLWSISDLVPAPACGAWGDFITSQSLRFHHL